MTPRSQRPWLLGPRGFPGKATGVVGHFLPRGGASMETPLAPLSSQATPDDSLLLTGYSLSLPPGCALVGPVLAYQKGPEPLQPMTSEVSWLERAPNRSVLRGRPSPPRRQTLGRAPTLHSAAPLPTATPAACQPQLGAASSCPPGQWR